MTDWTSAAFGYDFSHHNGVIDWPVVAATQPAFVVLKAMQGHGVDPRFDANRRGAEDNHVPWLWYPFLTTADDDSVVAHALSVVGDPRVPGALDWEARGVSTSVVELWIDALPRKPWAYYGLYPPAPVTPKIATCLRWLPEYPGSVTADPRLPMWDGSSATPDWSKQAFCWQWSETARVAGVSTPVDADRLSCSRETFDDWYMTGNLRSANTTAVDGLIASPLSAITRVLRLNSSGGDVAILQKALGVNADGSFGPATRRAVREFQGASGLVMDGVVGPATLAALSKGHP